MCINPFPLREKCPNTGVFWSVFSHIWTEHGDLLRKLPYSVRMRGNADRKKTPFLDTSRSVCLKFCLGYYLAFFLIF